jgi:hypothetical protein
MSAFVQAPPEPELTATAEQKTASFADASDASSVQQQIQSNAQPAIPSTDKLDPRIDCIVPLRLEEPIAAEKVLPLAQYLRRTSSKRVHIEGHPQNSAPNAGWEALHANVRYDEIRAGVQLANRRGALNELEFSQFVSEVQTISNILDSSPDLPDMLDTVQMARELDGFAAQCDVQLSINIIADSMPWTAHEIQTVAVRDGLLLSRDGTRFVKLDAQQQPVFSLQFENINFLRDDLTYKGGATLTLLLDVPQTDANNQPFRTMCDYAIMLAARINGQVVDDGRRPLAQDALFAIEKQLAVLYERLDQAGLAAGSPLARRLFSD